MRFICEVMMDNAAFADVSEVTVSVEDDGGYVPQIQLAAGIELARILRRAADDVESGERFLTDEPRPLLDANGNTVGAWSVDDDTGGDPDDG